jgi:hypothetical protein
MAASGAGVYLCCLDGNVDGDRARAPGILQKFDPHAIVINAEGKIMPGSYDDGRKPSTPVPIWGTGVNGLPGINWKLQRLQEGQKSAIRYVSEGLFVHRFKLALKRQISGYCLGVASGDASPAGFLMRPVSPLGGSQ